MLAAPRGQPGRRPMLLTSATHAEVEAWVDEAVDRLASLPESCSLDVADRGAPQLPSLARALGVTYEQCACRQVRDARASARASLHEEGV